MKMKTYFRLAVTAIAVLAFSVDAQAAISVSSPLHNTGGVTGSPPALPPLGSIDANFTTSGAGSNGNAYVSTVVPGWASNTSTAQWISINTSSQSPTANHNYVDIYYTTTLGLVGSPGDTGLVTVSGNWGSDGFIPDVIINGSHVIPVTQNTPPWAPLGPFSFSGTVGTPGSGFSFFDGTSGSATNTITIHVREGGGYTGIIIDNFTASIGAIPPVPEPTSVLVWSLLGLVGGLVTLRNKT